MKSINLKVVLAIVVLIVIVVLVIIGTLQGPYVPGSQATTSTSTSTSESISEVKTLPENVTQESVGVSEVMEPTENIEYFRQQTGMLALQGELRYPDSTISAGASKVYIGSKFNVSTTKNWLINLDGNTLNAVHSTGPSVCIMQTALFDKFFTNVVDEQLSAFLSANGIEQGTVTDIFYNGKVVGRMASSPTVIDGEDYILDAGIFLLSKEVYQIVSVYPPETEETVTNFYNSINYSSKAVVLK